MSRSWRSILRLVGASALVAAAGLVVMPPGSGAEEPIIVGWWYRDVPLSSDAMAAQSAGTPVIARIATSPAEASQVPPPPAVPPLPLPTVPPSVTVPDPGQNVPTPSPAPDGGLLVAGDPTGARAMAALRFDLPDAAGAILRLTIATGSTPVAGVRACPALTDWQAGPDQAWSRRPAHDCDRLSVSSTKSSDGTTLEWQLPDSFRDPQSPTYPFYDVLLVPPSGDGTPFQVAFNKPGSNALEVTSLLPEIEPYDSGDVDYGGPSIDPSYSSDGYDVSGVGSDGTYTDGPLGTVEFQPTASGGGGGGAGRQPLDRLADALENPTTRRLATLALLLIGGYAYWQSGRSADRAPRLLGALAGPSQHIADALVRPAVARPRGIGRFVRDRPDPPPRL